MHRVGPLVLPRSSFLCPLLQNVPSPRPIGCEIKPQDLFLSQERGTMYKYQHGHTNDVFDFHSVLPWQGSWSLLPGINMFYINQFQVFRASAAKCGSDLCLGAVKFWIISTDLLLWLKGPGHVLLFDRKSQHAGSYTIHLICV